AIRDHACVGRADEVYERGLELTDPRTLRDQWRAQRFDDCGDIIVVDRLLRIRKESLVLCHEGNLRHVDASVKCLTFLPLPGHGLPMFSLQGKSLLITGGTGSFGKLFVKTALERLQLKKLVVFSRDELKQFEMQQRLSSPFLRYFIGDVRDQQRLR